MSIIEREILLIRSFCKFLIVSPSQRDGGEFNGDSPLHTAVKGSDTHAIQQLLDNNANVDSQVCLFVYFLLLFMFIFE